mmetsp:Transcript_41160/g.55923  ORF Transcript_41160/g.55923 Transcript_41160/m.55923 type:complete len:203 (-) Transcript_41160:163-771(-)
MAALTHHVHLHLQPLLLLHLTDLGLVVAHLADLLRDHVLLLLRLLMLDLLAARPLIVERREGRLVGCRHVVAAIFLRPLGRHMTVPGVKVVVLFGRHGGRVVVLDILFEQILHLHLAHHVGVLLFDLHRPQEELGLLIEEVLLLDDAKLAELVGHRITIGLALLLALLSLLVLALFLFLVLLVLFVLLVLLLLFLRVLTGRL